MTSGIARRDALTAFLLLVLITVLYFGLGPGFRSAAAIMGLWALAAVGINMAWGHCGLALLGQNAFVAIGAYATALGTTKLSLPWLLTLPLGMLVSAVVVAAVSVRTLRLQEIYFGIVSLSVGFVVPALLGVFAFTGGTGGIFGLPQLSFGGVRVGVTGTYFVGWSLAVVMALLVGRFARSRDGLGLRAAAVSIDLASSNGVPVARQRLIILMVSASMGAVAGSLFTNVAGSIFPEEFSETLLLLFPTIALVGGLGTTYGPILAALGLQLIDTFTGGLDNRGTILYGVLLAGGYILRVGRRRIAESVVRSWPRVRTLHARLPLAIFRDNALVTRDAGVVHTARDELIWRPAEDHHALSLFKEKPVPQDEGGGLVVCAENVQKRFQGVTALAGANLSIRAGTIHALVGPNGAGKSTLINIISGLYRENAGTVRLYGTDVTSWPPERIARLGISRTFQIAKLIPGLTDVENVALGSFLRSHSRILGSVFGLGAREYARMCSSASAWLRALGVEPQGRAADSLAFPAGRVRLVELARTATSGARLLLLDEPCSGLTKAEKGSLGELLQRFVGLGGTICLVEHDMDFVREFAHDATVLDAGVTIFEGTPAGAFADPAVISSYLSTDAGGAGLTAIVGSPDSMHDDDSSRLETYG